MLRIALTALTLLMMLLGGCAHAPPAPARTGNMPANPIPLELNGVNSQIQFDFTNHPAITAAYDLAGEEFCYLQVGQGLLICAEGGSYLLFGPEDGILIVKDNPLYHLSPGGINPADGDMMHALDTTLMIAASLDRLPDALADYLGNPGPHRLTALALANQLLEANGAIIAASARGGTFTVGVRFNAGARETLLEAVQSDDNPRQIYRIGNKSSGHGDSPFIKRRPAAGVPPGS
jgi:hypothetical protein